MFGIVLGTDLLARKENDVPIPGEIPEKLQKQNFLPRNSRMKREMTAALCMGSLCIIQEFQGP